jgi:hypothetical protein
MVVEPTDSVTVQVPVAGKPVKATLPVPTEHVVWVIAPTVGAIGTELTINAI